MVEGEPLSESMLRELWKVSKSPTSVLASSTMYELARYVHYLASQYEGECENPFSDVFWVAVNTASFVLGAAAGARRLPNCDVAHAQNSGVCGFLCSVAKAVRNVPFIITEHGILLRELDTRLEGYERTTRELFKECFRSMMLTSYEQCEEIIEISDYHAELALEQGAPEDKIKVVYSGIETWKYSPGDLERKYSEPKVLEVGTITRIERVKGIDVLIEIAARTVEQIGNVVFHVVGPVEDEAYYEECRRLVKEYGLEDIVRFHGPCSPDEVVKWLRRFHVFLLPSRSEGLPMALLEAMSCGCPIIASEVGAVPYIVDRNFGRTFRPEDADEAAKHLVRLLYDPFQVLVSRIILDTLFLETFLPIPGIMLLSTILCVVCSVILYDELTQLFNVGISLATTIATPMATLAYMFTAAHSAVSWARPRLIARRVAIPWASFVILFMVSLMTVEADQAYLIASTILVTMMLLSFIDVIQGVSRVSRISIFTRGNLLIESLKVAVAAFADYSLMMMSAVTYYSVMFFDKFLFGLSTGFRTSNWTPRRSSA